MGPDDIGADKLAHAYSVTAHRCQGPTVDVTHALEDGGGRELAYVAMSRARGESHVHVVAPDIRQAARRLAWAWGQERRQRWAHAQSPEERLARLYHERQDLRSSLPPDRSAELDQARRQLRAASRTEPSCSPAPAAGPIPFPAWRPATSTRRPPAPASLTGPGSRGPWTLGPAQSSPPAEGGIGRFDSAKQAWEQHGRPYADQLEATRAQLGRQADELEQAQRPGRPSWPSTPKSPVVWPSSAGPSSTNRRFNVGRRLRAHTASRAGSPRPPLAHYGRRARDRHVICSTLQTAASARAAS